MFSINIGNPAHLVELAACANLWEIILFIRQNKSMDISEEK